MKHDNGDQIVHTVMVLSNTLIVYLLKVFRLSEVCRAHYCTNVKSGQVLCPGLDDVVDLGVQSVTQSFFTGRWTFQAHQAATKEDRTAGLHRFI